MRLKHCAVLALLLASPAWAADGSWGDNFGGLGHMGTNADRATQPGGGWRSWCCGDTPGTVYDSPAGNWGSAVKRSWGAATGWFSAGKTLLGEPDYSAPGYGIGHSTVGSGSGGTAGGSAGEGGTAGS